MELLERLHQGGHGEEVIAADKERQLRVDGIAVEIGEIVDFRLRELQSLVGYVAVGAVLPWREDIFLVK